MSEYADLLIIGAGPAGMAAALAAAPSGARIVLLDDNPLPGGQIWRDGPQASCRTRRVRCANDWTRAATSAVIRALG